MIGLSAAMMLALASCNGDAIAPTPQKRLVFNVGNPVTRSSLNDVGITDLWLFDYMDGQLKETLHQSSKDDKFGEIDKLFDYGEHTFYFVASRGKSPTVTVPVISWIQPSDTFWASVRVSVSAATPAQTIILSRVATRIRITITDELPPSTTTLSIAPSKWYYGLNITSGEGADVRQQTSSITIPSSYVGQKDVVFSVFGLSPASPWSSDVKIYANSSDASVTLKNVSFAQNTTSSAQGRLFSGGGALTIDVNDSWNEGNDHIW